MHLLTYCTLKETLIAFSLEENTLKDGQVTRALNLASVNESPILYIYMEMGQVKANLSIWSKLTLTLHYIFNNKFCWPFKINTKNMNIAHNLLQRLSTHNFDWFPGSLLRSVVFIMYVKHTHEQYNLRTECLLSKQYILKRHIFNHFMWFNDL